MSSTACGALAAGLLALSGLTTSCSSHDPAPPRDPDAIVLTPATDSAVPHSHVKVLGTGTSPAAGGYRLTDLVTPRSPGPARLSFRVSDRHGAALTAYRVDQTKLLHLYLVRTDYREYRHLHPVMNPEGAWSTRIDLAQPGHYRLIAEFVPKTRPDAAHIVLAHPFAVPEPRDRTPSPLKTPHNDPPRHPHKSPKDNTPSTPSTPGHTATGAAGNTDTDGVVQMSGPRAMDAGVEQIMTIQVSDGHGGLLNLGTYLGSYAHLTAFNTATGQFVHAHPLGAPEPTSAGSELTFHLSLPTAGRYQFFVQVRVDGFIHTLALTSTAAST